VSVAVVTAASGNYVPMARVMASSLQRHHPEVPVLLGLTDRAENLRAGREPFELVPLDELGVPRLEHLLFRCTRPEAAIAIKPFILERALDLGFDAVVYVDADVMVLGDLSGLLGAAELHAITLVPHLLEPLTGPDRVGRELNILQSGVFNGGVLGVKESEAGRAFLHWWQNQLVVDCRHAVEEGMHHDQRWLDLVPSYFEGVHLHDDPAIDVAHWNLPERDLAGCKLFHFSGFDPGRPEVLTRYSSRLTLDDVPAARPLFDRFGAAVLDAGWDEAQRRPYTFGSFDNGEPIADAVRVLHRELGEEADRFGDPYRTDGPDSFFHWLAGTSHTPESCR
jgi:hypothetical protein